MRFGLALWALLLTLAAAAPADADVDDMLGKRVVSVRVEQEGSVVSDPRVAELLRTLTGEPLDMATVRESIVHLLSLGRYDDVQVRAELSGGGVAVVYELVPRSRVSTIVLRGAEGSGIDGGRLRELLVSRFGATPRPSLGEEMSRLIEEDLRGVGYLDAAAKMSLESVSGDGTSRLMFDVVPGARATVGSVDVAGEPGVPPAELIGRLRLTSGAVYDPEALTRRIESYLEEWRRRGYLTARLTVGVRRLPERTAVALTLTAARGPRVRVDYDGDPIPEGRRADLVPVEREGSADEDLLEDSGIRIEEYLRSLGYREASARFSRREADGELVITYTVHRGPLYRIEQLELSGPGADVSAELATRLRVREGQPFSVAALNADISVIEDFYRRNGFASVRVSTDVNTRPETLRGEVPVSVRIEVEENARTIVRSVRVDGATIPTAPLVDSIGLRPGRPFFITQLAIDRDAIQTYYANLGYQTAVVTTNPVISDSGTDADVVFTVREGPQLFVDHVIIVGNERTQSSTIERELQLKSGEPLGLEAINESQRRLASLGLFRRVRLTDLAHGDATKRDLLVTVEEAPVTTLGYGGGLEAWQQLQTVNGVAMEQIEMAPRAFFEVGRRNLFGKNRSINLFTRVSVRPPVEGQERSIGEYRVIGTFREPRALGLGVDAYLTTTFEQQRRSSFNFSRRAFNAQVGRRLTPKVSMSGNYQIQRTELFDQGIDPSDKRLIDRAFPQVRLSSFSLSAIRDSRDDGTDPRRGAFLSANGQIAARKIGSEVGFAKTYLTAQAFRPIERAHGVVVATSARLGMASGFPRLVQLDADDGTPLVDENGNPVLATVRDLPASERFFAGGDTTIRGFALDQVGRPGTLNKDGFPIGGGGLVILNAELRLPVGRGFGVVGFIDAGNVFAQTSDIDMGQLRSAVGFGVRYKSPIGPIRFDLGFKTHRKELAPGLRESASAVHISLGQAF